MRTAISVLLSFCILPSISFAASDRYSCSTDAKGKAVVLDEAKPGKTFALAKIKSVLNKSKRSIVSQQKAVRSNTKLSKVKKAARLAALKSKLDDVKAELAVVNGCKSGTPGGGAIRNQFLVESAHCYNAPFNDCDFKGSLLLKSNDRDARTCLSNRTISITKEDNSSLGTTNTGANSYDGSWEIDGPYLGAGTYTIAIAELKVNGITCAAATAVWSVSAGGSGSFVSEQY